MGESAVTAMWERAAGSYDQEVPYFELMGRRIVGYADLQPGQSVLDVACGAGAVLLPAAGAVGPGRTAVGIDIVAGMVRSATDRADLAGLQVATATMDAEYLGLKSASFDVVTCAFGLGFFGLDGLREMRRVLRPGGRLVATVRAHRGPGWEFFDQLCADYGLINAAYPKGRQASRGDLGDSFGQAGLVGLTWATDQVTVVFADPESWWRWVWSHGERGYVERLSESDQPRFRDACYARLEQMRTPEGIPMTQYFRVAVASAPPVQS